MTQTNNVEALLAQAIKESERLSLLSIEAEAVIASLRSSVGGPLANAFKRMRELAKSNRRQGGRPFVADEQLRDLLVSLRRLNEALEQLVGLGNSLASGGRQLHSALVDLGL